MAGIETGLEAGARTGLDLETEMARQRVSANPFRRATHISRVRKRTYRVMVTSQCLSNTLQVRLRTKIDHFACRG